MSKTLPASNAGEPRTHLKVVANLLFYLVDALVRPVGDTFELAANLTFRPRPGDVVWGTGNLTVSVACHDRGSSPIDTLRMEAVVPGPEGGRADPLHEAGETLRDIYALVCGFTRVRVIPNDGDAVEELGSVLMEHLAPRVDSRDVFNGTLAFSGVEDAGRVIPVRIAAPDFGAAAQQVPGANGWDRSVVYHWEAIEAPFTKTAVDNKAVAQPIDPAPVSAAIKVAKAKAQVSRRQARRPSAGGRQAKVKDPTRAVPTAARD